MKFASFKLLSPHDGFISLFEKMNDVIPRPFSIEVGGEDLYFHSEEEILSYIKKISKEDIFMVSLFVESGDEIDIILILEKNEEESYLKFIECEDPKVKEIIRYLEEYLEPH